MKKEAQLFRALWTVKINFLVKTKGAVTLNYLYFGGQLPKAQCTVNI
jgi:hypothetical protein